MTPPLGSDVPIPTGLVLAPFRALRYDEGAAGPLDRLVSPPYDVIDEEGVRRYEAASPHNVVRLILPQGPESGPGNRYEQAAALLREWRAAGVLRPDREPALYVYETREGEHVQRGLVGALGLVDPAAGIVLPHENTMAGIVGDRLSLTAATATNTEAIFLVYDGGGAASAAVAGVADQEPIASATTEDGIGHRLWAITDPDRLDAIAADLHRRRAVIADGHHRYANFLQHQADRHAAGDGPGPWDFGLAFLVDATAFGPQVHPIHRVVPSLPLEDAVRGVRDSFADVRQLDGDRDAALAALADAGKAGPAFVLAGPAGRWLVAEADAAALDRHLPAGHSAAWRGLDVTVVHHALVRGLWGLEDDESTVWYRHDAPAAEAAAAETGGTAVLLNATPVDAVVAVAAAGERMPRKSTYFAPKPRTGFLLRAYADA